MKFSAGFDRIVVSPLGEPEYVKSRKEPPRTGVIVSAGPGVIWYRDGDTIVYGKYAGSEIEGFIILHKDEVLARVETDD